MASLPTSSSFRSGVLWYGLMAQSTGYMDGDGFVPGPARHSTHPLFISLPAGTAALVPPSPRPPQQAENEMLKFEAAFHLVSPSLGTHVPPNLSPGHAGPPLREKKWEKLSPIAFPVRAAARVGSALPAESRSYIYPRAATGLTLWSPPDPVPTVFGCFV